MRTKLLFHLWGYFQTLKIKNNVKVEKLEYFVLPHLSYYENLLFWLLFPRKNLPSLILVMHPGNESPNGNATNPSRVSS